MIYKNILSVETKLKFFIKYWEYLSVPLTEIKHLDICISVNCMIILKSINNISGAWHKITIKHLKTYLVQYLFYLTN